MAGETTITIVGNLGSPAELRITPSGTPVANFSVASTPRTLDRQSNEWKDGDPLWLRCNVWREMAEHVAETLTEKGMRVIVQGRLRQRSYEKDGQTKTVYELEVDEVGPALRYAVATVTKAPSSGGERSGGNGQRRGPSDNFQDPWASTTGGGRSAGKSSSSFDSEPPF